MTQAEVIILVHNEMDRMFGVPQTQHSSLDGEQDGKQDGRARNPQFYPRFLELMSGIHRSLDEMKDRLISMDNRLASLEWQVTQGSRRPWLDVDNDNLQ